MESNEKEKYFISFTQRRTSREKRRQIKKDARRKKTPKSFRNEDTSPSNNNLSFPFFKRSLDTYKWRSPDQEGGAAGATP